MHFTTALALASSIVLVAARPTVQVSEDDAILYGNGRFTVVKRADIEELQALRESGVTPPKPGYLNDTLTTASGEEVNKIGAAPLSKRANTIVIPNPASDFLGWDTQMSAVVKGAPTTLTVSSGYNVANSISVGVGASLTLVKDFLEVSTSIDYSQTWTSTLSQGFSAEVPAGKYGAFVSNAWTHRESGNIWQGSIGGDGTLTYYQAESFKSKNYDGLAWVDGVIVLCTGDEIPLRRCLGEGTL
ncbi:hypothetical protein P153DRAFT_399508 [Dothidotthia symphoricarpi CBS 119687]|uniref:Celp0028 effector like protein n=1 Tax=Dothidotthia symphoricarpi CBS 119687 TaxID=1392245 RepID=A0A6A6A2G2_9PLEO|nr:uncharacterized protein P153DRAFT_399508 [Dothidotthia symphoricarpi CBS 119687]KAF2126039.1 hypothetical protein P153DRAFT_399508 [Dothidotthia symphoricarpi CBS 119687]